MTNEQRSKGKTRVVYQTVKLMKSSTQTGGYSGTLNSYRGERGRKICHIAAYILNGWIAPIETKNQNHFLVGFLKEVPKQNPS